MKSMSYAAVAATVALAAALSAASPATHAEAAGLALAQQKNCMRTVPMPANTQLTPDQAATLAAWVLTLK
jgi:cytochrome c